jgi:5'/3'-nucleotidase
MTRAKSRKSKLRILVSNDDGIHAPGLAVAEKIARTLTDDIWVVAPETEQSGASHSLTLTLPLRLRQAGPKRFAISGTPTDCVMMAGIHLMKDRLPDLVISGVNRGFNVADDVTYSGTVAAAMEGAVLGIPSVAMSQAVGGRQEDDAIWACALAHGPALLKRLVDVGWPASVLLNINFPPLPAFKVTRVAVVAQGQRDQSMLRVDERVDARGRTYFWIGFKRIFSDPEMGTDLRAIHEGQISVTPLHLNLTEWREQERLSGLIEGSLRALKKPRKTRMAATPDVAQGWGEGRFRVVEPPVGKVKKR